MIVLRLTTYMQAEYARRNVTPCAPVIHVGLHLARAMAADAAQPTVPPNARNAKRIRAALEAPTLREVALGLYQLGGAAPRRHPNHNQGRP